MASALFFGTGFHGSGKFAEGSVAKQLQTFTDNGICLNEPEEGAITQDRQNETLNDLHAYLNLDLSIG